MIMSKSFCWISLNCWSWLVNPGLVVFFLYVASDLQAEDSNDPAVLGRSVVVVYNSQMPESKQLAEFYAEKRLVPRQQIVGLNLSKNEEITRKDFNEELQKPLLKFLAKNHLLNFKTSAKGKEATGTTVGEAAFRYLVLCYGVPVKVAADPSLQEAGGLTLPEPLRKNGASVDSELSLLPLAEKKLMLTGPFINPTYAATNIAQLHPTNGVIIVARLDGPSAAIARGMVEKSLLAEQDGLWGRAYFDSRGLTEGAYKQGDEMFKQCADLTRNYGFDTWLDSTSEVFPATFPLSDCAIYGGWYSGKYDGPFARAQVEFVPGAFAYHLHSSSANVLRSDHDFWAGPLLARGATATMGCTEEPFLAGTPDISVFLSRWIFSGFTLGEAALASQAWLSWQIIVLGDPLYRPFAQNGGKLHQRLLIDKNKKADWGNVVVANRSLKLKTSPDEVRGFLISQQGFATSAVMLEKVGDISFDEKQIPEAITSYLEALKKSPSPQQRVRITFRVVPILNGLQRENESYELLQELLKAFPDFADPAAIYSQLSILAEILKKPEQSAKWKALLTKGTPP